MRNFTFVILSFLPVLSGKIDAQQLTPFVVSSSGGFYSNTSGMLSFTAGEMSAVATFTSPSAILTQGFQQYWDLGTSIIEDPSHPSAFGIYPNPSNGHFTLFTETEANKYVDVKILDLMGKEILQTSYYHPGGTNVESIDLSHVAQGIYNIVLTVKENTSSSAIYFLNRISIVK